MLMMMMMMMMMSMMVSMIMVLVPLKEPAPRLGNFTLKTSNVTLEFRNNPVYRSRAPRVCKRWFPNGDSSLVRRANFRMLEKGVCLKGGVASDVFDSFDGFGG